MEFNFVNEYSNISLPDGSFSFCDNEEETLSAIRLYADSGTCSFSLYFHPAFADRLFADNHSYLQQLLSKSSLANIGQYVYSIESGSVTFADASFSEVTDPFISAEDVISFLCEHLPTQPSTITIPLVDDLIPDSFMNQIITAVYSLGVASFRYSVLGNRITLSDLSYYDNYYFADSKDDVLTYMQSAKINALDHFRIYCSDILYLSLSANNASEFFSLLNQTGFTDYSVSHSNDYCIMIVENAK